MKPLDLLIAITVPMIWGAGFTVAKGTFDQFPPIFLMGMRFSIAALVLIWFVKPMWDQAGRLFLAALVGGMLAYSLQFTGLNGMDASTAVLIVQLEVVFVSLFAGIFFKDKLAWQQWIAMAFAILLAISAQSAGTRGASGPVIVTASCRFLALNPFNRSR